MENNKRQSGFLEFSCQAVEKDAVQGEIIEDSLIIYASDQYAQGNIYSSDTRMRLYELEFMGEESKIGFCFDASAVSIGSTIRGEFVILSNYGEYVIPFQIIIHKPQLQCSLGSIKNLFHFTNLAQQNWAEAVELFYSQNFVHILQKSDKNSYMSYIGLSRSEGNEQNVEEFLIEVNKKTPIIYTFDIEGFLLEDVQESVQKRIVITKNNWGYSYVQIKINGEFLSTDKQVLTNADFSNNMCEFTFCIHAEKLHNGVNSASILFSDACNTYTVPVDILMDDAPQKRIDIRNQRQSLCRLTRYYADIQAKKQMDMQTIEQFEEELDVLLEIDEDNLLFNLYRTHLLIKKERFNEAKWYMDELEQRFAQKEKDNFFYCYYLYLTTLVNCEEEYVKASSDKIETIYVNNSSEWRIGWFILQMNESLQRNKELRWEFMKHMFSNGCYSPLLFYEAVLLLQERPTFLLRLGDFEESVLWYGARHQMLKPDLIEQIQYLAARKKEYATLLYRTLCEIYKTYKSPQTVASICYILILGEKKGPAYYHWFALGVEHSVRVTGLYEYYMMSLELDKYGDIMGNIEIPKMVLMYFAYQSTLDYERNAFLYAYIIKNRDKYPDLEQSYRIAIERFVVDQIKAGHINENLAYLYKKVLVPQMVMDETAYAYTPLLFMHRIYVDNPKIKSIVVIHEKVNGESTCPVVNCVSMIPIYGSEYKLFLQDENGNRFTKSISYENKQLMQPEKQLSYITGYMRGRLSFDIYLCEVDKNYITISQENVKRFKNLAESTQVVESFKKEIRIKLLRFYYDNDMIGELDAFLEDIEADEMEASERAEFIKYMISRGMFDKAYYWIKSYGVSGVETKAVARLVSKRIVSRGYEYEEFLVNVAYYIYRNMKYDENILRYLLLYYMGKSSDLRKLWKTALDLELDVQQIMERILRQLQYTGTSIPERDSILLSYAACEEHDSALVNSILIDTAYEYFVCGAIVSPEIFDMLYQFYAQGGEVGKVGKLALLKFWAEECNAASEIPMDVVRQFVQEFLHEEIYFPFYTKLAEIVPELHYIKNSIFIEYRTTPQTHVYIHYVFDTDMPVGVSVDNNEKDKDINYEQYDIKEMREMYEGIYISMFQLFHGEALQYYIAESRVEEGGLPQEVVTHSGTLYGDAEGTYGNQAENSLSCDRFNILNDILISVSLQDEMTAQQLTEEYLYQDFCARELFRVL